MDQDHFTRSFEEIVEKDANTISFETPLASVDTWDSLSQVGFLAFVDERFGKVVNSDALEAAATVSDLYRIATS